jgi:tRNA (guanine-N7-)-methyltransferase
LLASAFALSWGCRRRIGRRPRVMARLRNSARILKQARGDVEPLRGPARFIADAAFFSLEPERLFARPAPLEIEIGAGKGDFILERAREFPQRNFLAIERGGAVFRWLAVRTAQCDLPNLRALYADARPLVGLMLPSASVAAYHIYFPDPWPKNRHSRHRLFSRSTVCGLARTLVPAGHLYLATDVVWYFDHIVSLLAERGFQPVATTVPGADKTNFGRRFAATGRVIHSGCFEIGGAHSTMRRNVV